jgi:NAD(P)-dependent dehydrogenase (short-subunit alcohol dehydrogenase family)
MNLKTVIVTGASRGIGAAVARQLSGQGAAVVLSARSTADLEATAGDIRERGGRCLVVPGDIGDPETGLFLVKQTMAAFGRLDGLVNNAGMLEPIAPIAKADPAAWSRNLTVNLVGAMALTQAALPYLRPARGRLINVSSGASQSATAGWSAYSAAKAGLNRFTAVLAAEEPDVTALAVRPGVVDTEMQTLIRQEGAGGMTPESHARFIRRHEQGELLPPDKPGLALAMLALHAPLEWSGRYLSWDDAEVRALVDSHS